MHVFLSVKCKRIVKSSSFQEQMPVFTITEHSKDLLVCFWMFGMCFLQSRVNLHGPYILMKWIYSFHISAVICYTLGRCLWA